MKLTATTQHKRENMYMQEIALQTKAKENTHFYIKEIEQF